MRYRFSITFDGVDDPGARQEVRRTVRAAQLAGSIIGPEFKLQEVGREPRNIALPHDLFEDRETHMTLQEAIKWLQDNPKLAVYRESNQFDYLGFCHWNGNNLVNTSTNKSFELDERDILNRDWRTSGYRTYAEYFSSI